MVEFCAGVLRCEAPRDHDVLMVARHFPGARLQAKHLFIGDAAVQALPFQDTDFALGWVQPAPMLRGVVELQALANSQRLRRLKSRVKTAGPWVLRLSSTTRMQGASG